MTKLLTVIVPSYNSESFIARCVDSLLALADERVEIILVDDGSTDGTAAIADGYARTNPGVVRVVHQENRGHGGAVNTGIGQACGLFIKVVDSDDWVDRDALAAVLETVARFAMGPEVPDLIISNYVYEKVGARKKKVVHYRGVLPRNRVFGWEETGRFRVGKYLLMHSLLYRTDVLRASGLSLPNHTFYVDNLYAFVPISRVRRVYYLDVDLYRYFIGRSDQSVNEVVMISRLDQQMRVNRLMIDHWCSMSGEHGPAHQYRFHYLEIVTIVSSILAIRARDPEALRQKDELWAYLRSSDARLHRRLRTRPMGIFVNLPGDIGRAIAQTIYLLSQKRFGFN